MPSLILAVPQIGHVIVFEAAEPTHERDVKVVNNSMDAD